MKVKGLVAVIIACVLTLCTVMPAFASSSFAVDQELSKTGTIYETVSFTSLSTSQMDSNREFKAMQSELPEFKEIEFDRDTSSANYKMEVRYASVYTVSQDEARKYGYEKYQNVINQLVENELQLDLSGVFIQIDYQLVIAIYLGALCFGLCSSYIPAFLAGRLDPIKALKQPNY